MNIKHPAPGDIPTLRRLWKEAFGDPDRFLDGFFRTGFSADRCRCTEDVSAALYWFDCTWMEKKLAYIYAVATKASHRGRGLCRALMEDTHRHLQALGYAGTILVPGDEGLFRLYEKLGYVSCCPRQTVTVAAGETAIPVTPVSADAYAALRKKQLPPNAIWQEDPTLPFLGTFSGFYTGHHFAFSGAVEGSTLYVQEFIGDMEQAPGIIAGFHCTSGKFPVSGGAPYAMYRSLDGDASLPQYFGIPLN